MAAKTLIVARNVWVSKGVLKPVVNRRMGWTKSLVGSIMTWRGLIEAEQRNSTDGISGRVGNGGCCCCCFCCCCWGRVRDVEEEEERG